MANCTSSTHFSNNLFEKEKLHLFDALLRFCTSSTHFSKFAPFRRTSPILHLFDALLRFCTFSTHFSDFCSFSTHFSDFAPFRRTSPILLLFDAFSTHFSMYKLSQRISSKVFREKQCYIILEWCPKNHTPHLILKVIPPTPFFSFFEFCWILTFFLNFSLLPHFGVGV